MELGAAHRVAGHAGAHVKLQSLHRGTDSVTGLCFHSWEAARPIFDNHLHGGSGQVLSQLVTRP